MIRRRWLAVAVEHVPCPVHGICHEFVVDRFWRRETALQAVDHNEIQRRRALLAGDEVCGTFTWEVRELGKHVEK